MVLLIIFSLIVGFVFSYLFGLFLVPILKRIKASQHVSLYLRDTHKSKEGTPTMGGFIFIVPTLVIMFVLVLFNKIQVSYTLISILFVFVSYTLIGFIDDYLIIKKNNNKGLSQSSKLLLQVIVAIVFFYLFMVGGNEPLLWIHLFHIKWDIGFWYGVFILFVLVASSNAVNLTDGLDGLACGLSIISFVTIGIISFFTGWLDGYYSISVLAFVLVGALFGFLVFNKYPASVFMGDTGSLALGATLGAFAIMTRHELLLVIIGFVFVLETSSCIIQIIYYKVTGKRFFPMTPIHHTFEKIGMSEIVIVSLFWVVGIIAAVVALFYGVVL